MTTSEIVIDGICDSRFAHVRDVFIENFVSRDEVGGAVCVFIDGKKVVDLWGGKAVKAQKPDGQWQRDTIVRMMSVNKAATAICAHMLADRGLLDYDKPVAAYWPEFGQAGKEKITVRTLMSGLAALVYADAVPDGGAYDWDIMVEGLARQAPNWPPGTRGAYHSATYGHLVGELIRRITGKSPGTFFREELATPLDLDYWFALPPSEWPRLSEIIPNPGSATLNDVAQGNTTSLGRAWRIYGRNAALSDAPAVLEREMPSSAGRGNARAIAKLYAALAIGGTLDGVYVLSPETLQAATRVTWDGPCGLTGRRFRYAMGVYRNISDKGHMGPNEAAFGHAGLGGAIGFADPVARLSFGYSPNYMCEGDGVGDRCRALVAATFQNL